MSSFGLPALLLVLTAAVLVCRFPIQTATASLALACLFDCLEIAKEGVDVGITIYPLDIACAILLMAGCIATIRCRKLPTHGWWFAIALFGLAVFNLMRGASEFGIKPAGNGIRGLVYLIIPPIAFMLIRPLLRMDCLKLSKALAIAGLGFSVIALCRWTGVLPTPEWTSQDNLREIPRVLNAEYAMLLGQALIAVVYFQIARGVSWWGVTLGGLLTAELLFLQHRSVWMATAVGVIWMAIRTAKSSKKLWLGGAVFAVLALAITIAAMSGTLNVLSTVVGENIREAEQDNSTWEWRTKGYEEALNRLFSGSADEILAGPPAGRNLGSGASIASVFIHDRYVDTLVYYGICGVILFALWLVCVANSIGGWVAKSQYRELKVGNVFLQSLLLAQLTYFVPYSGGMPLGAVMGLLWAVSVTSSMRRKPRRLFARVRRVQSSAPVLRSA